MEWTTHPRSQPHGMDKPHEASRSSLALDWAAASALGLACKQGAPSLSGGKCATIGRPCSPGDDVLGLRQVGLLLAAIVAHPCGAASAVAPEKQATRFAVLALQRGAREEE